MTLRWVYFVHGRIGPKVLTTRYHLPQRSGEDKLVLNLIFFGLFQLLEWLLPAVSASELQGSWI